MFGNRPWTAVPEVRIQDADGQAAGNVDLVICSYDENGVITDFGSLEIQGVYITGNVRTPFEKFIEDPEAYREGSINIKHLRADYLSSSRKRLAPQLMFKGEIFHAWGKKQAVAIDKGFYDTLPFMVEVDSNDADFMWIVVDVDRKKIAGDMLDLRIVKRHYTKFREAMPAITRPKVGSMSHFLAVLQSKFEEQSNPPHTSTLRLGEDPNGN